MNARSLSRTVGLLTVACLLGASLVCLAAATTEPAATTKPSSPLPPPVLKGSKSLEEVLATRRSVRRFEPTPLTTEQIGQLCWAGQGVTEPKRGLRTAPSAMAKYPLELYVVTAQGAFHYLPKTHSLETVAEGDALATLRGGGGRGAVAAAPAVFVIAADPSRLGGRVAERAQRWADLEAGHVAQNLLLEAVALDLGAVPVGGFNAEAVAKVIQLPEGQQVVYLVPVGVPAK